MSPSVEAVSESDVAPSSSASSEPEGEVGIASMSAAMASSNVLPFMRSLEMVTVRSLPCSAGFLDFAELSVVSLPAWEDPESHPMRALRPSMLASEGTV